MHSYYGRMPDGLKIKLLRKNGVHKMMLEDFICKKIDKMEIKITKIVKDDMNHLRKDTMREIKKIKEDIKNLSIRKSVPFKPFKSDKDDPEFNRIKRKLCHE